jgi:hypothetical protein
MPILALVFVAGVGKRLDAGFGREMDVHSGPSLQELFNRRDDLLLQISRVSLVASGDITVASAFPCAGG